MGARLGQAMRCEREGEKQPSTQKKREIERSRFLGEMRLKMSLGAFPFIKRPLKMWPCPM